MLKSVFSTTKLITITKVGLVFQPFWAPIPPKKFMNCNKTGGNIIFDVWKEKCDISFKDWSILGGGGVQGFQKFVDSTVFWCLIYISTRK